MITHSLPFESAIVSLYVNVVFEPLKRIDASFFSSNAIVTLVLAVILFVKYFVPSAVNSVLSCFTLVTVNPLLGLTKNSNDVSVSTDVLLPSRVI